MNENQSKQNSKQELKVILNPELYEELRFCFYAEHLEKMIYRPVKIDAEKWQCSCGFVHAEEVCPVCGMQKNLAFGKINEAYLSRHRRERLSMMTGLAPKVRKPKKPKKRKYMTAVVVLLIIAATVAVVVGISRIGGSEPVSLDDPVETEPTDTADDTSAPPLDTTSDGQTTDPVITSENPDTTDTPGTSEPADTDVPVDTTTPPDTTAPPDTTTPPVTTSPVDTTPNPQNLPNPTSKDRASGNTTMGGKVYSADEYDYIAKDGIASYDKNGAFVKNITTNSAEYLCGYGKILYYASDDGIHKIDLDSGADTLTYVTEMPAKMTFANGTLYYYLSSDSTLYAMGETAGRNLHSGRITSLEESQGKLYFSSDDGLYRVSGADAEAVNLNTGGAMCSFIAEMDNLVFYTVWNQLMAYRESDNRRLGVYGLDGNNYTAIISCGNRVYYRAESGSTIKWYETDILFSYKRDTGVSTSELYVTSGGLYDGNLNFVKIG